MSPPEILVLPTYRAPQRGLLSLLPTKWVPYAELMRLGKPFGTMGIYFPYLFGTLFAACIARPTIAPNALLNTNLVLLLAAFMLRSVGCTWNDIVDRDLDRQVARCRLRPMARGAVSPRNAHIFTAAQCLVWLAILAQVSARCLFYAVPLVVLVGVYPFSKRVTHYAQVVLGFTLTWGLLIGCVALGVEPMDMASEETAAALVCLYASFVIWTVIYDTVYAYQDVKDDVKAGVKSMAVRYRHNAKPMLSFLAAVQVGLLVSTGVLMGAGVVYFLGACICSALSLALMIWKVNLGEPDSCWWWFSNGALLVGGAIFAGFVGEYSNRLAAV